MSMSFDNAIWLAGLTAQAVLLGLLLYRQVWRSLPVFFSYVIWDFSSNLAAFGVNRYSPAFYFNFYFAQTALDSVLLFCVLVELTWSVLRPVRSSLSHRTIAVVAVVLLLVGAAIWPFAALPGLASVTTRTGLQFAQLQQTVSILRILFFVFLAGGSQLLSIGWRDRELQIVTGFGLYSVVSLTAAMLHMHQTTELQYYRLSEVVSAAYDCCLIYWVVSFAQKEAERREFTPQMQSFLLAVAGAARSTRVALTDSRSGDADKRKD
jgi:hypothetical protein